MDFVHVKSIFVYETVPDKIMLEEQVVQKISENTTSDQFLFVLRLFEE